MTHTVMRSYPKHSGLCWYVLLPVTMDNAMRKRFLSWHKGLQRGNVYKDLLAKNLGKYKWYCGSHSNQSLSQGMAQRSYELCFAYLRC